MLKIDKSEWDNLLQRIRNNDVTLVTLDLFGKEIGDIGIRELSSILKNNNTLASLKLGCNDIGDLGAKDLSLALKDNHALTSLDLGGNPIGDIGAKHLSQALKENQVLTELDLYGTEIEEAGMKELSLALKDNYSLTSINLFSIGRTTGVNKEIKTFLGLGTERSKREIKAFVKRNGELRDQLHQAVCQGNLPVTKKLLTQGVSFLSKSGDYDIPADTSQNFGGNTPLHWAVLKGHFDLVVWILQEMHHQRIPIDRRNGRGYPARGVTAAEIAASNPTLATLFQAYTPNTAAPQNSSDNNQSTTTQQDSSPPPSVSAENENNSEIRLQLPFFAEFPTESDMRDWWLQSLRQNDHAFTSLDLTRQGIGAARAKDLGYALRDNFTLTTLNLNQNGIIGVGIKALSFALKTHLTLRSLILSNNGIGDAEVKELSLTLRYNYTLTALNLGGNKIKKAGAKALSLALENNHTLAILDLGDNNIGITGTEDLSLTLQTNTSLTSLNLQRNQIKMIGTNALSQVLKNNHTLASLDLSDNDIGVESMRNLGLALQANSSLTALYLRSNGIGDEGTKNLSLALKDNHTLTLLDLGINGIGAAGAEYLSLALKDNITLTSLDLHCNQIGDLGAKNLSVALKDNNILTSLNLRGNRIGVDGVKALNLALIDNLGLTSLDLSTNRIRVTGAHDLSNFLEKNRILSSLALSWCEIGTEGAKSLISGLKNNYILTSFDLQDNEIDVSIEEEITTLLHRNSQLCNQLHQAVCQANLLLAKRFFAQGLSLLSTTGDDNNTPLHWAVINRHQNLVSWLIREMQHQNISLDHFNNKGKTARQLAADNPSLLLLFQQALSTTANSSQDRNNNNDQPTNVSQAASPSQAKVTSSSFIPFSRTETEEENDSNVPESNTPRAKFDSMKVPLIASSELTLIKSLAQGGFGEVFLAEYRFSNVAVKKLRGQFSPNALEEFQQEACLMAGLYYPYIVRLFGITDSIPHCIVMEYLPKGDLFKVLHSKQNLSWEQRLKIAFDIARGLNYLHKENILHRDLKSKNVLLDNDFTAKLSDFGFAKIKTESSVQTTHQVLGTTRWMAPEIMSAQQFTAKADVYSLAVVLWELSAGEVPFAQALNDGIIINWVSNGKRNEIPVKTPKQFADLIENCWSQRPEDRPETSQIIHVLQKLLEGSFTNDNVPKASPPGPVYDENIDSAIASNTTQTNNSIPGNVTYLSSLTSSPVFPSQQLHRNSSQQPLSQATSFTTHTAEMNTPVQLARQLGFHAQSTRGASRIQQGMSNNNNSSNENDSFSMGKSSKPQ